MNYFSTIFIKESVLGHIYTSFGYIKLLLLTNSINQIPIFIGRQ